MSDLVSGRSIQAPRPMYCPSIEDIQNLAVQAVENFQEITCVVVHDIASQRLIASQSALSRYSSTPERRTEDTPVEMSVQTSMGAIRIIPLSRASREILNGAVLMLNWPDPTSARVWAAHSRYSAGPVTNTTLPYGYEMVGINEMIARTEREISTSMAVPPETIELAPVKEPPRRVIRE
jgi:hypothetical protein